MTGNWRVKYSVNVLLLFVMSVRVCLFCVECEQELLLYLWSVGFFKFFAALLLLAPETLGMKPFAKSMHHHDHLLA